MSALSQSQYIGDGATTTFAVTFSYVSQSNVTVSINATPVAFTWVDGSHINITPAPALGSLILLQRVTPVATASVVFQDGSVFGASALNQETTQLLDAIQEIEDTAANLTAASLKVQAPDTTIGPLPLKAARANTLLGFDSSGNPQPVPASNPSTPQDSSLLNYLAAYAGAVSRTIQDKFSNEMVSVYDFMTQAQRVNCYLGIATIDVTAAIQAAATAARGKTLSVPGGSFLISGTIYIQGNLKGAGIYNSTFVLASAAVFDKPALVATGVGFGAPAVSYSVNGGSSFGYSYFTTMLNSVLADMTAANRSCPWGVDIGGFQITTQSSARGTVKQNGLMIQQLALFNVHDIQVSNLNGCGLLEEGTQDAVFHNIHFNGCGRNNGANDQAYEHHVDSFLNGASAFNASARVHHYYVQYEVPSFGSLYTGATGTRPGGFGGSTTNSWHDVHAEYNTLYGVNSPSLNGNQDKFDGCSWGGAPVTITHGQSTFHKCDFAGSSNVAVGGQTNAQTLFTDCAGIAAMSCSGGNIILNNTPVSGFANTLTSGQMTVTVNNGVFIDAANGRSTTPYTLFLNNATATLNDGTSAGDNCTVVAKGGKIIGGYSTGILPPGYIIHAQGTEITAATQINVAFGRHETTGCLYSAPVQVGGQAPGFYGIVGTGNRFTGAITTVNGGADITCLNSCKFEASVNIGGTTNSSIGSAINCTILTGFTITAVNKAGCFTNLAVAA